MIEEIWKDVVGFEGEYVVSNLGNVRSVDRIIHVDREGYRKQDYFSKGRLLMKQKTNGYYRVNLNNGKTSRRYLVHRLVAEAFIENPNNYPIVNHKDQNRSNNVVDNLEWCTYKYNTNYGDCVERIKKKMLNSKKTGKYLEDELIEEYQSIADACRINNADRKNLVKAIKMGKKYRGYYWRTISD